jgi:hypothetical protein
MQATQRARTTPLRALAQASCALASAAAVVASCGGRVASLGANGDADASTTDAHTFEAGLGEASVVGSDAITPPPDDASALDARSAADGFASGDAMLRDSGDATDVDTGATPLDAPADVPPDAGCGSSETLCNGACVDLANDPAHCGACTNACPAPTPACVKATCLAAPVVLASGLDSPYGIAVDDNNVYFTMETPNGSVMQMTKAPGSTPLSIADGQSYPGPIAVDGSYVYWGTNDGVNRVPIGGGDAQSLSPDTASRLALNATTLFWGADFLESVPKGGGDASILEFGQGGTFGLALDATNIYWSAELPGGTLNALPIAGGTMTTLASNLGLPGGIAMDASNVYFVAEPVPGPCTINAVPIGGGPVTTLATGQVTANDLVLDSGVLYWTNTATSGAVMKMPVTGGTPVPIALDQKTPWRIAIDATSVYWTNLSGGTVMKAPK